MLRVMLIDNDLNQSKPLKQSLIDNGFDVIAHVEDDIRLQKNVANYSQMLSLLIRNHPAKMY